MRCTIGAKLPNRKKRKIETAEEEEEEEESAIVRPEVLGISPMRPNTQTRVLLPSIFQNWPYH